MQLSPHCLSPEIRNDDIRSLVGFGNLVGSLAHSALYPRQSITRGKPKNYFEENQQFPGLFSLSLRPTTHPGIFQHSWVRTSIYLSIDFALVMGRSLSFGSILTNYSPYSDSVSLRLLPLRGLSSLIRITRRFIMQKARRHPFHDCS